jgi:SNF2 family DNA or RNA helicase
MTDYTYKSKPFDHQHEDFMATRDKKSWAYLWEMGLGKSKIVNDVAAWLYARGEIDFLLVIAPNGVHSNWVADEIPAHMPDFTNYIQAEWGSTMKAAQRDKVDALFDGWKKSPKPLRILTMNIEAFGVQERYYVEKAGKLARAILNSFNVLMVVDESSLIKNYVNRTQRIIELGMHAKYRRILNGTPTTTGPLDLYYQFKFLNGGGLRPAGQGDFLLGPYSTNATSFKNRYAVYEELQRRDGRRYPALIEYQNLEELSDYLAACSSRRTKKECLDLPEKLYEKVPVTLHPEQKKRYDKVIEEGILELKQAGQELNLTNVLVIWLRAQQVVGGFVPVEDPEDPTAWKTECILDDFAKLPRVEAFMHYIEQAQGKLIIYARFLAEVKAWKELLGDAAVTYVGKQNYKDPDQREANKVRFQGTKANDFEDHDPSVKYLIMNKAGARGITLTQASYMFFYSNEFSLDIRLQTEDRCHRIGSHNPVTYFDGIAEGTIDEKLVESFRANKLLADIITKDDPTTWV